MIKELKEEIKFIIENPIVCLIGLGTITGILPALLIGAMTKLFGI